MASHLQYKIGSSASIRLRRPDHGEDFAGEVEVASSRSCDHSETMCSKCVNQWRQDWKVKSP